MCVVVVLIFVSVVLCCAPSCVCLYFVLLSAIFIMCSPPSSGLLAHLRALIDPLAMGCSRVGFHLLIGVLSAFLWAFILHSRAHCLLVPYPWDYTLVRGHGCLFVRCCVNFHLFWSIFVSISCIFLSPYSLRALFLPECFTLPQFYMSP
jgi:hypothetical protein